MTPRKRKAPTDKERLDWLAKYDQGHECRESGMVPGNFFVRYGLGQREQVFRRGLRCAIDAAMRHKGDKP